MKQFKGKVAVITGASHGIGFGIAERCAQEGMKVVLAGINNQNLIEAEKQIKPLGAKTLCVQTDVSKLQDIERLAESTLETFGAVHLLVNNAGVIALGSVWESSLEDWRWMIDVNLWGVIYGIRVFVPIMLKQNTECHIVNTASLAGFLPNHSSAAYQVTKHGVVALTENLFHSLVQKNTKIRASVLCPGYVKSHIVNSERNRPVEYLNREEGTPGSLEHEENLERLRLLLESGITPQEAADILFQGITNEQLYILTDQRWNSDIQKRTENIVQQQNPI